MPYRLQPCKSLSKHVVTEPTRPCVQATHVATVSNFCSSTRKTFLIIAALLLLLPSAGSSVANERAADDLHTAQAQHIVDALRAQLGISAGVSVVIVDRDPRVVSVRARRDGSGGFALSVERSFAEKVTALQLRAALAHELGHVWIATHHPYLQTEQLANRVAMRVVSRESLVDVYRALWGAEALHGSLETFLGVQAMAEQE
jgi:hypothetical protein